MVEKEKRTKGGGTQNIGATSMRCGCGFTTSDIHAWSEHRRNSHKR